MPNYTRAQYKASINNRIHGKIGMVHDINTAINDCVKSVIGDIDLLSMKRKTIIPTNLFDGVDDYSCPSDLMNVKVIDIPLQVNRNKAFEVILVPPEEYDRYKDSTQDVLVTVDQYDFFKKLRVSTQFDDKTITLSSLDSISNITAFGDAESITLDGYQFVKGSGSVKFNISSAGGTTAGITESIPVVDLTNYISAGSIFSWVWITSISNITNYKLRLKSSVSNYYEITATQTNEGTAFKVGWNLLRFDLSARTTTGTPDMTNISSYDLFMTKSAGKINEVDYRFDQVQLKLGRIAYVQYYSNMAWQNASGTYLENSTSDTDYINCDADEYKIFVEKGVSEIGQMVREYADADNAEKKYQEISKKYQLDFPSEAKLMIGSYHDFASIDGDDNIYGVAS